MSYTFNADEVFEMAIEMEKNGFNYYVEASKKISEPKQKELLLELANMEKEHIGDFKKLKKEFCNKELQDSFFDPDNLTFSYLKALVDTKIFFKREETRNDIKEILKDAIRAEKESILFYLGMKDMIPANLGKEKIDSIIKEEMSHIMLLSKKLTQQS